ncbi:TPA: hypothetical protein IOH86_000209 [Salmonella enterica]|nr:hypothetical protein [Salmonella enterica]
MDIVFPAPAGINRACSLTLSNRASVPRASGDKPSLPLPRWTAPPCSPRQRG